MDQWGLTYAAVFAANVDCSSPTFDWSSLSGGSPYRFPIKMVPVSNNISFDFSPDPTCYYYFKVTDTLSNPVPAFMNVNQVTKTLQVTPVSASDKGTFNLRVFVSYWDGISPYFTST